MFTGIIQHVGAVTAVSPCPAGKRLRVDLGPLFGGLKTGASVCIDGACLTAAELADGQATFDVVKETLARSSLGLLRAGSKVNLEPSLPAGGPLDGHIVQGHVDGLAELERLDRGGGQCLLYCRAPAELTAQMVAKGSVALSGVSLTLVEVGRERFSVALAPTTLQRTTLGLRKNSDPLNVELDIIGKYVRRYLGQLLGREGGVSLEKLREAGFA